MNLKKFYRAKGLTNHLGIGLSTIWLYVKQEKIKSIKISIFDINEVEKALFTNEA